LCIIIKPKNEQIHELKKRHHTLEPTIIAGVLFYGLLVIVPGYRSRGPGSIAAATRFSEK
jgi:hypothetical protein